MPDTSGRVCEECTQSLRYCRCQADRCRSCPAKLDTEAIAAGREQCFDGYLDQQGE
jgi:hypothetical protein